MPCGGQFSWIVKWLKKINQWKNHTLTLEYSALCWASHGSWEFWENNSVSFIFHRLVVFPGNKDYRWMHTWTVDRFTSTCCLWNYLFLFCICIWSDCGGRCHHVDDLPAAGVFLPNTSERNWTAVAIKSVWLHALKQKGAVVAWREGKQRPKVCVKSWRSTNTNLFISLPRSERAHSHEIHISVTLTLFFS